MQTSRKIYLLSLLSFVSITLVASQGQSAEQQKTTELLLKASQNGDALLLEQALEQGADPNTDFNIGGCSTSALIEALRKHHGKCVHLLLMASAKPTAKFIQCFDGLDQDVYPALHYVACHPPHDLPLILELLLHKANPNQHDDCTGLGRSDLVKNFFAWWPEIERQATALAQEDRKRLKYLCAKAIQKSNPRFNWLTAPIPADLQIYSSCPLRPFVMHVLRTNPAYHEVWDALCKENPAAPTKPADNNS